jgi:hypothetical protein
LTETSSRVVLDVKEGMALIEGEGGLVVAIVGGCGSCTKDLNASPNGANETWSVSTVGGVAGTTDNLFLRFEIDLASDGREGGSGSKGREMSWLSELVRASNVAKRSSAERLLVGLVSSPVGTARVSPLVSFTSFSFPCAFSGRMLGLLPAQRGYKYTGRIRRETTRFA